MLVLKSPIMNPTLSPLLRGFDLAGRIVLAIPGGYAFASVWAFALGRVLPTPDVEASLIATMTSFAIYAAAVVWVFAARSAMRAMVGLAATLVPAGLIILSGVGR